MNIKFKLESKLLDNDMPLIDEIKEVASQVENSERSLEEVLFGKEMTLEDILS